MKCMYCLFGLFLLILIVPPSFEINSLKKAGDERNNIVQGQGQALERRKRGLYPGGVEYQFFLRFFEAFSRVQEFLRSISRTGGIVNWQIAFGASHSIDYFSAIDLVVNYYAHPHNAGFRREVAIQEIGAIIQFREGYNHGHLDAPHRTVVNKWKTAKDLLQIQQK